MSPKQIERFFTVLARQLSHPARVILTGAAAGSLFGHVRPSLDIDFAIMPVRRSQKAWEQIESAVERTVQLTGIRANYAEDIDRWSSISFLDYRRHTRAYRVFGSLTVRLLDPAYWSIGKISRFLDPDVNDLVSVIRRQRIPAARLLRLWARAIRQSPRSPAQTQCRRQTEAFLRVFGQRIWGPSFHTDRAITLFRQQLARTSPEHRRTT